MLFFKTLARLLRLAKKAKDVAKDLAEMKDAKVP